MSGTRPTRVLVTADTIGGVWSYTTALASALPGVEFIIATMGPPPTPAQLAHACSLPNVTVEISRFALEWMPNPWKDVDAAGEWLLALESRHRPDVVHLNGFAHGVLPFRAPALIVGHSCCFSWWHAVRGGEPPLAWRAYRRRVGAGMDGAAALVAPTRAMLEELSRLYSPLPPSRVIANGAAPLRRARAKDPAIVVGGRLWDEAKNIAVLSRIAPRVGWPILVAGDPRGPLGSGASPRGLVALGRLEREEMAEVLAHAAIYVHPAVYEPFGLLPLEAALAGCALVLADIPTLRELWDGAADFADPRDPEAFARVINELIGDPFLPARAARARRRARRYSLERFGRAYAALYGTLAGAGADGTSGGRPCASRFSTTRS